MFSLIAAKLSFRHLCFFVSGLGDRQNSDEFRWSDQFLSQPIWTLGDELVMALRLPGRLHRRLC